MQLLRWLHQSGKCLLNFDQNIVIKDMLTVGIPPSGQKAKGPTCEMLERSFETVQTADEIRLNEFRG